MKEIREEILHIFKESKLLIAITAVIVVPILYAGMFLWAFWDPYDHLVDLPIAVVNEDEGIYEDGEYIELGEELVTKLKDEPEFDFHFIDKADAYDGLNNQDYYIVIEVPNDFSTNVTTLMDDTPKKLQITYAPNESYNFLASQIGETAMLQIEMTLEEKITETYAEKIFNNFHEIADRLEDASDATKELNEGAIALQDGTNTIDENLQTLASNSLKFNDGVVKAHSGTTEMANGASTLADGIGQLNDGSNTLVSASSKLKDGAETVADGVTQTNRGLHELNKKVPSLISGTNDVQDRLSKFKVELPKQLATQINKQLTDVSSGMNDGLNELELGIAGALTNNLAPGLSKNISNSIANKIIQTEQEQGEILLNTLKSNGVDIAIIGAIENDLNANRTSKEDLVKGLGDELQPTINGGIDQTVTSINDGFNNYKSAVDDSLGSITDIEEQISIAINPSFTQIDAGLSSINTGQTAVQNGIEGLSKGTTQLKDGSNTLANGQSEYVNSIQLFSDKMAEANSGANELMIGSYSLLDGMSQLEDASSQLSDGSTKLANGSSKLSSGTNELVNGTKQFNTEMTDAASEVSNINADENTYNMIANPVEVKNEKINEVPNYGTGFAPYFLSLGLFVGALLLSIVFPLREPAIIPKSGFHWFFSKFTVLFSAGVLQALIASGTLLLVLKLQVQSIPLFILYTIITSLAFITLIQFLVTCFEDPGRFAAIIILILQLTTSAGTFPLELIPKALQPFNYLLPMTYSVEGLKAVISSGDFHVMWQNAWILMLFAGIFIALTLFYFIIMYKKKFSKHTGKEISI